MGAAFCSIGHAPHGRGDDAMNCLRTHVVPARREKERPRIAGRSRRADGQILPDRFCGMLSERNNALFSSFARHFQRPRTEIDVLRPQAGQLADADPAAVEQLQHCGREFSPGRRTINGAQRAEHGLLIEEPGEALLQFGRGNRGRGVRIEKAGATKELKEGADRCEVPGNCSARHPLRNERPQECADGVPVNRGRLPHRRALSGRNECIEHAQVLPIRDHGVP